MKKIISLVMALSLACVPVYANNTVPIEATSATENEAFAEDYTMETADISDPYVDEPETIVTPVAYEVQVNLSSKRQAVVDRAYAWYNKTWTLTQPMLLWHNPATSSGVTVPAGTTVRGVPYTQFNCLYSIDSTLPGSKNYFELNEASTYETVVDTYCAGVGGNRTAPKYGAECVQLVYDAWYHGDDSIGKRDVAWSLIISDNKKRGLVDEIEYADIQPGDALAISSHIRLVVGINDNNTPNDCTDDTYECIEQTTANLSSKSIGTAKNTYTYSQLQNGGYLPYRYNNLDDGSTSESYTLSGIIRNATEGSADYGKAVEGVTVTRKASDGTVIDSAVTDATGTFSFAFTGEKGVYIFVLSKAGFQTFTTATMTIHQTSPSLGAFVIYEEETEAEIIASGTCGDNLTWTLDDAGTLTISGEGEMKDYSNTDTGYPWNDYINPSWTEQQDLSGIKKAVLCEGVTTLASEAFVQRRSRYSFRSGNVLENIQLPETLDRIEDYAFSMCTKLSNITIPKSVSHIAHNAFSIYLINPSDTASLQNIFVDSENRYYCDINGILCGKSSWSEEIKRIIRCPSLNSTTTFEIPYTVAYIEDYAFSYCENLEHIAFMENNDRYSYMYSIGTGAFYNCINLQGMYLPQNIVYMYSDCFNGCSSIEKYQISEKNEYFYTDENGILYTKDVSKLIQYPAGNSTLSAFTVPDTVTTIESGAFSNASYLENITIPDTFTEISFEMFERCTGLKYFTIPASVTSIEYAAFSGCSNLQSITIPETVTSIDDRVFSGCSSLESITIPETITSIGNSVFSDCSSLESITIPKTVTSIGDSVFSGCSSLKSFIIPETVTSIGDSVFKKCSSLKTINLPSKLTSIGEWAFADCSALTTITIPDSVTSIGGYAFQRCTNLASIHLPPALITIPAQLFMGCTSLTSIEIPENVATLDRSAFSDCPSLTSVYFYGDAPTIATNTFKNTPSSLTLYYISGKSGWTSPTWTDSNGVTYNTATFTPGAVDPKPTIPGDISGDGVLDYFDVTALYAAYQSGEVDTEVMDVNHDGVVDYYDVSKLYAAFRGTATLT